MLIRRMQGLWITDSDSEHMKSVFPYLRKVSKLLLDGFANRWVQNAIMIDIHHEHQ